jgi:hypothetical protein
MHHPLLNTRFVVPRTFIDQLGDDSGAAGFAINPHLATPYVQQWNVSVQRQLPKRTSLEVRVEFFNLPNNVTFFAGDQNINSTDFGKISSTLNAPRFLQTQLRFTF